MAEDVFLVIGNRQTAGWTDIRITRRLEGCPNDFEIGLTDAYPGTLFVPATPGDACQIYIGGDLALTGYVDDLKIGFAGDRHALRVTGRGKCQDLVDCSAEWKNGQISGASVLSIAQKLAEPYGIDIAAAVDAGGTIPQFNLLFGESAWEIIERICRYRALLAYEQPDGSLLLNRVGTASAASGFTEGVNVQRADARYTMAERYSEVRVMRQNTDVLGDTGDGGNLIETIPDQGVTRHRRLDIIAETVAQGMGADVATQRGRWEVARRWGRSFRIELAADSWRDQAGQLWTPNTLAPISMPSLKMPSTSWVIGEAEYRLDSQNGTSTGIVLMPAAAFQPEPLPSLQGGFADVVQAAPASQGGAQ